VRAGDLKANPKNWRRHPERQQKAMRAVLKEIGFADALLARQDDAGELILIDGHLRAGIAADDEVPVLILDVTAAEADKILATLDPLAAMAEPDSDVGPNS
jgi:ParB-like chromosome segregation protein Spo0J